MVNEEVIKTARTLIGDFVKNRRAEMNLSQTALAGLADIDFKSLMRLEAGRGCSLSTLIKILAILDSYLFIEQKSGSSDLSKAMRKRWGKTANN